MLIAALPGCEGDSRARGGLSQAEADELNQAANLLDAQQAQIDAALN